jgi:phosphate butyryltransferase
MSLEPIKSSAQLIAQAVKIAQAGSPCRVAVACAQDADVLSAISEAKALGFIDAVLVGDANKIRQLADEAQVDLSPLKLVDLPDIQAAAHHAAGLASAGEAGVIMKGFLPTSALLKTVLDKKHNLRGKNTLSHCAVLGIPGYERLLNVTDGGMVVAPDLDLKRQILDNAVLVSRAIGLSSVKVAVTAGKDELAQAVSGQYDDVELVGPVTIEAATSQQCDIYLTDSIEEGNLVAKSMIQFAEAIFAGVIVGARVPVSLVSRTDTVTNKKASLAIASLLAHYYRQHDTFGGAQ